VDHSIIGRNLWKVYRSKVKQGFLRSKKKRVEALKGVDIEVRSGEIYGLLGPNGAGKTTLIKILTTLLYPDRGEAYVNGYNVLKEPERVRATIGVMLMGERALYWKLTGRENLEFFSALYHVPSQIARERIKRISELLGLEEYIDRLVETYSSGQKITLSFAKALVNDAPLLFLDEPTVALDPRRALEIRNVIRMLNKDEGKTILLTTHIMQEADMLCDRVAIIDKGMIVAVGSPDELKSRVRKEGVLEVEVSKIKPSATEKLRGLEGVRSMGVKIRRDDSRETSMLRIICDSPRQIIGGVITVLVEEGAEINYLKPSEPTLEDVFIMYTGRALEEADKNEAG